jgi:hypothetical protein
MSCGSRDLTTVTVSKLALWYQRLEMLETRGTHGLGGDCRKDVGHPPEMTNLRKFDDRMHTQFRDGTQCGYITTLLGGHSYLRY